MNKKPFELFCIKNGFAKYFAKYSNLFTYIFSFAHFGNSRNDIFLYSSTNQINSTKCFSGTRVNQIVNKYLNR